MIKKNNFFNNFFINSKTYETNLRKTKFFFNSFKKDYENGTLPFLKSFTKDYKFEFSNKMLKKNLRKKNKLRWNKKKKFKVF